MIIDWGKIGEISETIVQFGGAWALVIGLLIIAIKYVKQIWIFLKDMILAPIRVKSMMGELKYNGGTSIKDSLLRIENRQISNEQKLIYVIDSTDNSGSFEIDSEGRISKVSVGYCHIVGRTKDELIGNGWVSYIEEDDSDRVMESWKDSMDDKRTLSVSYKIKKNYSEIVTVNCQTYPLINSMGDLIGWFGLIRKIS